MSEKKELEIKTSEEIWFDYQEYGLEKDANLTKDAQELKKFILKAEWVGKESLTQKLQEKLKIAEAALKLSKLMLEKVLSEFSRTEIGRGTYYRLATLIVDFEIWDFGVSLNEERVNDLRELLAVLEANKK